MHSDKHMGSNNVVMQLRVMREKDPTAKSLVFSQFVSTIDWLKVKLEEQGFGYRTISGSMTLQRRSQVGHAYECITHGPADCTCLRQTHVFGFCHCCRTFHSA